MKVKIIRCEDMELFIEDFINEINEFIKDKKVIDIKYQEFSPIFSRIEDNFDTDLFGSVLILYED